jgi:hypothetical protein
MGVDIYLNSIWKPWMETQGQAFLDQDNGPPPETPEDLEKRAKL